MGLVVRCVPKTGMIRWVWIGGAGRGRGVETAGGILTTAVWPWRRWGHACV